MRVQLNAPWEEPPVLIEQKATWVPESQYALWRRQKRLLHLSWIKPQLSSP